MVNFCLPASGDHVRIGQQLTPKVARCAPVDLPRWMRRSVCVDGALDKPRDRSEFLTSAVANEKPRATSASRHPIRLTWSG
jgi:hypothetical protein